MDDFVAKKGENKRINSSNVSGITKDLRYFSDYVSLEIGNESLKFILSSRLKSAFHLTITL